MLSSGTFTAKLIKKSKVSRDAYSFYFERSPAFQFLPGQYIKMTLNIENPDERGNSRFFSIASSPTEKDFMMITTRIIQSSFKKTMAELKQVDEVSIRGPYGTFTLDETEVRPLAFLAGGIGITPFRNMSVYASHKKLKNKMTLFASYSTFQDAIFYEELKSIAQDNFKFIVTITKPDPDWKGETGRIDIEKIKKHIENPQESVYYIAGPESMAQSMSEIVKSMGISENQLKIESFPGY